jgi:hypothetical protein
MRALSAERAKELQFAHAVEEDYMRHYMSQYLLPFLCISNLIYFD